MVEHIAYVVVGLAILVFGADGLVKGASRLAMAFGISPLVVGLTVVAFGTSAPELAVSAASAVEGATDLAVANVVGSNIANIADGGARAMSRSASTFGQHTSRTGPECLPVEETIR